MVCGEFSGAWKTRLRRIEESSGYLDDRLARVTRRHFLLRLSHERLEMDLLTKPATLRDALLALRRLLEGKSRESALPAAEEFLTFLAQTCQLEIAALHYPQPERGEYRIAARVGEASPLKGDDALLMLALERRALAHVQVAQLEKSATTPHLLVAPAITGSGRIGGLLTVDRMPFFALNEDTLQMLAVLLGFYADSVAVALPVDDIFRADSGCPNEFAAELAHACRMWRDSGVASCAVALVFGDQPMRENMAFQAARLKRGLDVTWERRTSTGHALVTLMPLGSRAAAEGYLARIELWLKEAFGLDFPAAQVTPHYVPVQHAEAARALQAIVAVCDAA